MNGGFVTDRAETAGREPMDGVRPSESAADAVVEAEGRRSPGRAAAPRARAADEMVALGEESGQVTAAVRVEVLQGLAREVTLALPAGLVVNQVNGATVGDWDGAGGDAARAAARSDRPETRRSSCRARCALRATARSPCRSCACRRPSAKPAASRSTSSGAGEIAERQARGLEPADPSELGDLVAGRESPSMIAFRLRPLAGTEPRSLTVGVVRYTPQAVLIANVEEARYRALASEDGRLLVEARYAVRNNQRSFLKVTMPPGSTLWSAEVAGRPIRPGAAEADAILLPLEKGPRGRRGADVRRRARLPAADRRVARQGTHRLDLPALDLPGLAHRRRAVLLAALSRRAAGRAPSASRPIPVRSRRRCAGRQPRRLPTTIEASRPRRGPPADCRRSSIGSGTNPADARSSDRCRFTSTFPAFGPSIFLASELTAEASAPSVDLTFKRSEGGLTHDHTARQRALTAVLASRRRARAAPPSSRCGRPNRRAR